MSLPLSTGDAPAAPYRTLIGVAAAALLGFLAYLLVLSWPLLFPPPVFITAAAEGCDLHEGACTARFDDTRTIRIAIAPGTLQANRPLQIQVETNGFRVDQAAIEFSGVDMNMGLIRNDLSYSGEGSFRGTAILPVCIRKRMSWRAIVNAQGDDGVHRASFDFEVYRQ